MWGGPAEGASTAAASPWAAAPPPPRSGSLKPPASVRGKLQAGTWCFCFKTNKLGLLWKALNKFPFIRHGLCHQSLFPLIIPA